VKLFRRSRDHGECKHALDPLSGGSQVGTWRILAPKPNRCERVEHHVVDFVLVPGLAFDARGGHFGCAGGFYDKLLVNGLSLRSWLVAGAFESQMLEKVPTDGHDV
jgi:5-formyltetrahydrofolate cyclo-ligase